MEKSIVLIDSENVLQSWRSYCKKNSLQEKIDYKKLVEKLTEGTSLVRPYFYDGVPPVIPPNKKKFLDSLSLQGFEVKTKIIKDRSYNCGSCHNRIQKMVQKGVDVALATDIIRHTEQLSTNICIVVSGDEDFLDAIKYVKDKGTKVWVCSFESCLSRELRRSADKFFAMEDLFEEVKQ